MKAADLRGECVVCGQFLAEADYDRQAVIAAVGPEGVVVCCAKHVRAGPGSEEYKKAVVEMSRAKAKQLEQSP
jgi:hypothetical protein